MKPEREIYTIGHSNLSADEFLRLLRRERINCVVDVRSRPDQRYFPQFNEDRLADFLAHRAVYHLSFCADFGPRAYDCLDADGLVDFERAVHRPAFQRAAARILQGLDMGFRIVLMGAVAEPLDCHRFSLLGRYFHESGLCVRHFLRNGALVTHAELERRMVADYVRHHKLSPVTSLFDAYTEARQRADAYRLKNREIGFRS